jgi:outer membrane lipoprotein carrier protein
MVRAREITDMQKWKRIWLLAALMIAFLAMQGAMAAETPLAPELQTILDRIEKRYADTGFTATFVQETTVADLNITDVASGRLMMKRPASMRWEYDKPDAHTIISDGEHLWIHRPLENQVMVGTSPRFFGREQGAVFLSDMNSIRKMFDISLAEKTDDRRYVLRLVPGEPTPGVKEVLLSVTRDTDEIFEIVIHTVDGNETRIELIDLAFTRDLPGRLFTFSIPAGTDVLQLEP